MMADAAREWDAVASVLEKSERLNRPWHQRHDIDSVVVSLMGRVRNHTILDVGSGTGYFTRELARKGARVTGVDISPNMIALANKLHQSDKVHFVLADIATTAMGTRAFDGAVANMSLMDIGPCDRAIKQIARFLRPGGRFVFSTTHPIFADQTWAVVHVKGRRFLARGVYRYLTSRTVRSSPSWAPGATVTQYHRPLQKYLKWFHAAGLTLETLLEVPSGRRPQYVAIPDPTKALPRRSFYYSPRDFRTRETARRELPAFLIGSCLNTG